MATPASAAPITGPAPSPKEKALRSPELRLLSPRLLAVLLVLRALLPRVPLDGRLGVRVAILFSLE